MVQNADRRVIPPLEYEAPAEVTDDGFAVKTCSEYVFQRFRDFAHYKGAIRGSSSNLNQAMDLAFGPTSIGEGLLGKIGRKGRMHWLKSMNGHRFDEDQPDLSITVASKINEAFPIDPMMANMMPSTLPNRPHAGPFSRSPMSR